MVLEDTITKARDGFNDSAKIVQGICFKRHV